MSKNIHLSVVIPSYNESTNLKRGVLDEVLSYLKKQTYSWEIILSDDGSSDGSLKQLEAFAAKSPHIKLLKNEHAGKGPTVQSGMLAAEGDWQLFTDFDQSTPLSEVEKLWPYAQKDYQVVIGSREIIGAQREKEPWYRHLMGRVFNMMVQFLAIPGILDTQCGFKLFAKDASHKIFRHLHVYKRQKQRADAFTGAFDVEALFLAKKYGYKIREVPIIWQHYKTDRVSPVKDSLRMLFDIVKIRWAEIKCKYE